MNALCSPDKNLFPAT